MSDDRTFAEREHDALPDPSYHDDDSEQGDSEQRDEAWRDEDRAEGREVDKDLRAPAVVEAAAEADAAETDDTDAVDDADAAAQDERPVLPGQRQGDADLAVGGGFGPTDDYGSDGYGQAGQSVTAVAAKTDRRFFEESVADKLRDRWQAIQIDFVDDPRNSVERAESLLDQVSTQLTEAVASRRQQLHGNWQKDGGQAGVAYDGGVATEDLRTALQEYRQLVNQLLAL
ncbi:hypothetical protein [Streptacidiphilus cavernicola]|uniref:Uncharacterized protein n=1 Tax=Streptacidiphilus cavernicola TaxID=3342716 RepID=A0ABV6W2U0_9ACTN